MKHSLCMAVLFLVAVSAWAQNLPPPAASRPPVSTPTTGFDLSGLNLPPGLSQGLMDQWWRDPATASRLHLSDDQKRELESATLNQRLALIDSGADALKSLTRLGSMLNAEQLDEAAYNQQIGVLSTAAAHLVQTLGDMALTPRKVLTYEQWKQFVAMRQPRRTSYTYSVPPVTNPNSPTPRPPASR